MSVLVLFCFFGFQFCLFTQCVGCVLVQVSAQGLSILVDSIK